MVNLVIPESIVPMANVLLLILIMRPILAWFCVENRLVEKIEIKFIEAFSFIQFRSLVKGVDRKKACVRTVTLKARSKKGSLF